jgi:site-specific DNA-cytosine methylase
MNFLRHSRALWLGLSVGLAINAAIMHSFWWLALAHIIAQPAWITRFYGPRNGGARTVQMRRYTLGEACALQGLRADFLAEAPFRKDGALKAVANGVPLPMGRAVARAVKRALGIGVAA